MNEFHLLLDNLKRKGSDSLIEAIRDAFDILFEADQIGTTTAQALRQRAKKHPFFNLEIRFIKNMIRDFMANYKYNFPETNDSRIPLRACR